MAKTWVGKVWKRDGTLAFHTRRAGKQKHYGVSLVLMYGGIGGIVIMVFDVLQNTTYDKVFFPTQGRFPHSEWFRRSLGGYIFIDLLVHSFIGFFTHQFIYCLIPELLWVVLWFTLLLIPSASYSSSSSASCTSSFASLLATRPLRVPWQLGPCTSYGIWPVARPLAAGHLHAPYDLCVTMFASLWTNIQCWICWVVFWTLERLGGSKLKKKSNFTINRNWII